MPLQSLRPAAFPLSLRPRERSEPGKQGNRETGKQSFHSHSSPLRPLLGMQAEAHDEAKQAKDGEVDSEGVQVSGITSDCSEARRHRE